MTSSHQASAAHLYSSLDQPLAESLRQPLATRTPLSRSQLRAQSVLRAAPYAELRSTGCEFKQGVLVLRGRVSSYFLKQLAQETVRQVDGVRRIINLLEVVSCHRSSAAELD